MHLSLIIKNIEKLRYQLNFEKCKNISDIFAMNNKKWIKQL